MAEQETLFERLTRERNITVEGEWLKYAVEKLGEEGRSDSLRWYPNL